MLLSGWPRRCDPAYPAVDPPPLALGSLTHAERKYVHRTNQLPITPDLDSGGVQDNHLDRSRECLVTLYFR